MSMRALTVPAISLVAMSAHAGAVMEVSNRDLAGGRPETVSTTMAQDGKLRVESRADGAVVFKDDAFYSLNIKDKTYFVMDRESMQKMADTLNPALKQMQEQMARMTPEQRAQMEKMMGGRMPGMGKAKAQEIKKTGRSDKIAGHACTYVQILEDGVVSSEMCVVAADKLPGGSALMEAAAHMGEFVRDMMSKIDSPWVQQMVDQQTAAYARIGGIPVLTRHYASGKPVLETTLKSIRFENVPGSAFEVPPGFTRKDMPGAR